VEVARQPMPSVEIDHLGPIQPRITIADRPAFRAAKMSADLAPVRIRYLRLCGPVTDGRSKAHTTVSSKFRCDKVASRMQPGSQT